MLPKQQVSSHGTDQTYVKQVLEDKMAYESWIVSSFN